MDTLTVIEKALLFLVGMLAAGLAYRELQPRKERRDE